MEDNDRQAARYRWWVLANVIVGQFIAAVDTRAVTISLPTLTGEFQTDVQTLKWTLLAFQLTVIGLVLILGRVGDTVGRKRTYTTGFAIFTLASALCGISSSAMQLIAYRVIQGVGAAMIIANGRAIISAVFPVSERGKALGLTSMGFHLGFMIGPSVGGFIIDSIGWRWLFYVNVPIGILGTWLAWKILQESLLEKSNLRLDWSGVVTLLTTLLSLFLGLHWVTSVGFFDPKAWTLLAVAVLSFVLFLSAETRSDQPILDVSMFRDPIFTASNLSLFSIALGMGAITLFFPFYLEGIRGYSASEMGLILMADSAVIVFCSPIGGWLSDRLGSRLLCTSGAVLMTVAYALISLLGKSSATYQIVFPHALSGLAWALFNSPNASAVFSSVGPKKFGQASGMLVTMFSVGQSMGVVAGTLILGMWVGPSALSGEASLETWQAEPDLFLSAFRAVCVFSFLTQIGAVIGSAIKGTGRLSAERQPAPGFSSKRD